MNPRLVLDRLSMELPDAGEAWEREASFILRAPARDGYRPNIRVTYLTAAAPIEVAELAREYTARLKEGVGGVTLLEEKVRAVRGAHEAVALAFRAQVAPDKAALHRVVIATAKLAGGGVAAVTVAASRPESAEGAADAADGELEAALTRVLASVSLS